MMRCRSLNKCRFNAVLLDADNTIFDFFAAEHEAVLRTAAEFGITVNNDDALRYSNINASLWRSLEMGQVSRDELCVRRFSQWFDSLGVVADAESFDKAYRVNLANTSCLFDGADEFVKKLSAVCPVYIVTNGLYTTQSQRMNNCPIKDSISGMYISESVGYPKPDKRYFDFVLSDIGIEDPSKVIILGDSLTADMQGGKNAGIITCYFNKNDERIDTDLCDFSITDYSQFFDIII